MLFLKNRYIIDIMSVSIEFQIAGLVYTLILCAAFFRKVKWDSVQNRIYKVLLLVTVAVLTLDIASVISIDHRDTVPLLNAFLSKAYIVVMDLFIYTIDLYAISCATNRKLSPVMKKIKTGVIALISSMTLVAIIFSIINTLYYSGYGRRIYSYGPPSDLTYVFSTFSVAFVIFILLLNVRHMRIAQLFSILSFCIMEGVIAIVQMFNKELLLVGFGSAATVFIMYFTVENPDAQTINRLSHANKRARELIRFFTTSSGTRKSVDIASTTTKIFPNVCVMVFDIVDFLKFSNRMGIERLSKYLSAFFEKVDSAADSFKVEKFKNFGSFYCALSGAPEENPASASEMVHFAIEVLNILKRTNAQNGMNLQIKIGIASGPLVVDLVSNQNLVYNICGQPTMMADILRVNASPNSIHVSESVYAQLNDTYDFTEAEDLEVEGGGTIKNWQLDIGGGDKSIV